MDFYKKAILSKIPEYLKKFKIPHEARGKVINMQCPFCKDKALTAQVVAQTHLINCLNPLCNRKEKFTLISIVKKTEVDKKDFENEKIIQYIKELFQVKVVTPKDQSEIDKWFNYYANNGLSLTPVKGNDKIPVESAWQTKEHKDSKEWQEWLNNGLNLGVRTGEVSNLTIIDIDIKPIPEEIIKIMGETLIQESSKGYHLFYYYEADLPKTRIDKLKIDIENNGGQVLIYPSGFNKVQRKFINENKIIKLPLELKNYLNQFITVKDLKSNSEKVKEEIQSETYKKCLIEEGCVDNQTEILTDSGWQFFKDLDKTEKVATLNLKTREIRYQRPIKYFEYDYKDDLICIDNRSINLYVTPNHNQLILTKDKKNYNFLKAKELNTNIYIPRTGIWKGKNRKYFVLKAICNKNSEIKIKMGDWLEFLGLYLAEGYTIIDKKYNKGIIHITQIKKLKEIKKILKKMPFKIGKSKDGFKFHNITLANYLKQFGKSYEKFVPKDVKLLNKNLLIHFLYGFWLGDGTSGGNNHQSKQYYSSSKKLIDDIQEILFKIGKLGNIGLNRPKGSVCEINGKKYIRNYDVFYIVERNQYFNYFIPSKNKIKKVFYSGKVYCVEVPNHTIFIRRHGKCCWTGNSGRHDYIFHLGCILRKQLSVSDTEFVLGVFNKISCQPQLPYSEMKNITNSIVSYNFFDEKELANQILQYLKDVSEASLKDIERIVMGDTRLKAEEKEKIDKVIAYLRKEELIQKKGNIVVPVKKLEWQIDLMDELKPLSFKVPYFNDLAYFSNREMIIIGMKTGQGKTHLAMNIVKQLKQQNIKTKYVSLEKGSKFKKIALQLGLVENDFEHTCCYEPTQIELEKNAVTIVDWLNIPDFKNTHLTFGHFSQQLDKQGGFLIVFLQLKEDGSWFAINLVDWFAVLAVKYFQDEDSDGSSGYFDIGKVRDRICKKRVSKIPCKFNWETKELIRADEIKNENNTELKEKLLESGNEEG